MYCSHCGAQIPDDAAFCPSCGQKPGRAGQPAAQTAAPQTAPPPSVSYAQPTPRYVETIQTEAEFIQNYRNFQRYGIYSAIWIALQVLYIVADVVLGIWFLVMILNEPRDFIKLFFLYLLIGLIITVSCVVWQHRMKKNMQEIDAAAKSAYKNYQYKINGGTPVKNSGSIFSDSNSKNLGRSSRINPPRTSVPSNGWRCPDCGRVNASYVGTCACGKRKNS